MSASDHLGPQFLSHEELGALSAGDFPGKIGHPQARARFDRYNRAEGLLAKHREAGGPLSYLDGFTEKVREDGGVQEPITVADFGTSRRIWDGHHRALAAHALGQGVHARVEPIDRLTKGY